MNDQDLKAMLYPLTGQWHRFIAKPYKTLLNEHVSPGVFHCMLILQKHGDNMTMSELARHSQCSKQQMTKLVDKLIENGFAERISDPDDRRIIRLRLTESGQGFLTRFWQDADTYYDSLLGEMTEDEQSDFCQALGTLHRIFTRLEQEQQ